MSDKIQDISNEYFLEDTKKTGILTGREGTYTTFLKRIKRNLEQNRVNQFISLETLYDVDLAEGDNLRRIGKNIGFNAFIISDVAYRDALKSYIFLRSSNGAIPFFYEYFEKIGFDITKIDIWQDFQNSFLYFDDSFYLDGTTYFNPEDTGLSVYEGRVDFHVKDSHNWLKDQQDIVDIIRFVGKPVNAYEVLELENGDSSSFTYQVPDNLYLDSGYYLDDIQYLNPIIANLGINELRIGNGAGGRIPEAGDTDLQNTIYTNNNISDLIRQNGLEFYQVMINDFIEEYDEIGFFIDSNPVFIKSYSSVRRFIFDKKEIRFKKE